MFFKERRRRNIRGHPTPEGWDDLITSKMPLIRMLPDDDRAELIGHAQVLNEEKYFEGASGFEISDEVRATISLMASILLLHRPTDYFPTLTTIVVYPHEYRVSERHSDEVGVVTEHSTIRLGESWDHGVIVLSWEDVLADCRNYDGAINVVVHEFTHQLDLEDGLRNGRPAIEDRDLAQLWADVFTMEFDRFRADVAMGVTTAIDPYGAEAPVEFFPEAVVAFFHSPGMLSYFNPRLYNLLAAYFRQDPRTWNRP